MRFCLLLVAMLVPALASAQRQPIDPQAARQAAEAGAALEASGETEDRVVPLAASRQSQRISSRNEAYNRARAAEGRLGARLGNDMSFRISD
jgi:hypothetical protein